MRSHHLSSLLFLSSALAALAACTPGAVRNTIGLVNESPDEFAVIKRAPLEVSPTILNTADLPAPQKGATRPQETSPDVSARQALIGDEEILAPSNRLSSGDAAFLQRLGASNVEPNIRYRIDAETSELRYRNKPVAERLFNWGGQGHIPSATVLDAEAEAKRIRENKQAGKSIIDGETPSIEE